jgi:nickel/cobalt tolerance cation efflux system protein
MFFYRSKQKHNKDSENKVYSKKHKIWDIASILTLFALVWFIQNAQNILRHTNYLQVSEDVPPLVMPNGDPHIRALMRTISASESSGKNTYALLYGGDHVHDLSQHPDQCIPIKTQVNAGKCSTASGRYQFLTSTWLEKASQYHPNPYETADGVVYSFEPEYQDIVVYRWLKDHHQWNADILTLLKEDRVEDALVELSGVWTSLGGGIEDNLVTPFLPKLYRQFLAEELASTDKTTDKVSGSQMINSMQISKNATGSFPITMSQ